MSRRGIGHLAAVPDAPEPPSAPTERPAELGLYAETRALAFDLERWRRLHEREARPIRLGDRARRLFSMKGGGVRQERGGWKFEERL